MCGIAGIVVGGGHVDADALTAMSRALEHRGPDDLGFLTWSADCPPAMGRNAALAHGRVGLAHRRLSILDLSELGWQPMASPDGRYFLVYNGEVYNYLELRPELERAGHRFASHSDTEVILAAMAEWGVERAVRRFEGMFAFALLDTHRRTLTLARDPFGIKPLYYTQGDERFAFASEIKALLALDWVSRRANPKSLLAYLSIGRCEHGEDTMFAGIRQLSPGGLLVVDVSAAPRALELSRTWRLTAATPIEVSRAEAAQLVRDAFLKNVHRHLRSDVPVGAALSGGLDSSAIVAGMRRVAPDIDLHAFSYFANDRTLSEETWARAAAAAADAKVHAVTVSPDALVRDIDALVRVQDEPFGTTSIYAQYNIFSEAARAGIKVMLDGQGADELLAGYASFVAPHVASLTARWRLLAAARVLGSSRGRPDVRVGEIARYVAASMVPRWAKQRAAARVHARGIQEWIAVPWFAQRLPSIRVEDADPGPDLRAHLVREAETSLLALLRYEDRNSMAFSVESRVPFLTTELAELLLSLPARYLIDDDGTRKSVLRDAMRGIVPDAILDRRDKIGFQTPERAILTGASSWASTVLKSDTARGMPCIELGAVTASLDGSSSTTGPHVPLWRILNLIRWTELSQVEFS